MTDENSKWRKLTMGSGLFVRCQKCGHKGYRAWSRLVFVGRRGKREYLCDACYKEQEKK